MHLLPPCLSVCVRITLEQQKVAPIILMLTWICGGVLPVFMLLFFALLLFFVFMFAGLFEHVTRMRKNVVHRCGCVPTTSFIRLCMRSVEDCHCAVRFW